MASLAVTNVQKENAMNHPPILPEPGATICQDWDDWSDQDEDDDWAPEKHGDNDWADQSWAPWRVRYFPGGIGETWKDGLSMVNSMVGHWGGSKNHTVPYKVRPQVVDENGFRTSVALLFVVPERLSWEVLKPMDSGQSVHSSNIWILNRDISKD